MASGGCAISPLRQIAEDYLTTRRALGFSLQTDGQLVMNFIDYLEQQEADTVTTSLAVSWATRTRPGASPARCGRRLAAVRVFARYLSAVDPRTEIPPADLMPSRHRRVTPHLYSDDEIQALVQAAATLRNPLRALTYSTLLALLATTGMRVGEAATSTAATSTAALAYSPSRPASSAKRVRCHCTRRPARPLRTTASNATG